MINGRHSLRTPDKISPSIAPPSSRAAAAAHAYKIARAPPLLALPRRSKLLIVNPRWTKAPGSDVSRDIGSVSEARGAWPPATVSVGTVAAAGDPASFQANTGRRHPEAAALRPAANEGAERLPLVSAEDDIAGPRNPGDMSPVSARALSLAPHVNRGVTARSALGRPGCAPPPPGVHEVTGLTRQRGTALPRLRPRRRDGARS